MTVAPVKRSGDFWAITSYFNPAGFKRRRINYRRFRERMALPLLALELAFDRPFELSPGDADILIQLRGGDVMWQKERLLNLALDALPPECDTIVGVDCDVIFADDAWIEKTTRLLDGFALVHPFSLLYHMGPDWTPEQHAAAPLYARRSAVFLAREEPLAEVLKGIRIAYGFAWAARRALFRNCRFYDACIIGGGDFALTCAAYHQIDVALRYHHMDGTRRHEHFLSWAEPFARAVGADIGYVDGVLMHLWHGAISNRHYVDRVDGLAAFGFDPYADLAIGPAGAWHWNSDKPDMHDYVRDYFAARREDG
jgi:hypothetical protein